MSKVLKIVSYYDSKQRDTFKVTQYGEIYINDESTEAFLLCSCCESTPEKQILRTIEEFLEYIKKHRSINEPPQEINSLEETEEEDPILDEDESTNDSVDRISEIATLQKTSVSENWLIDFIDIFKKCPCLWHTATAEWEKQFIDAAKMMITKYINTLTKRTHSVEYVEELFEKLKSQFLEKCTDESYKPNLYFQKLNFLLTSEMPTLDLSIYTDFQCTICKENLSSWEHLSDHLCDCHMEIEESDSKSFDLENEKKDCEEDRATQSEKEEGFDSVEFLEEFVEVYKNEPRLWDRNHEEYNAVHLRSNSYRALKEIMQKYNKSTTTNAVACKIKYLKKELLYARQRIRECGDPNYTSAQGFNYYEKLSFLPDAVLERKKTSGQANVSAKRRKRFNPTEITSCTVCNKKFSDTEKCIDHMESAHEDKQYKSSDGYYYCPVCKSHLKSKRSLFQHLRMCSCSAFRRCEDCKTTYRYFTEWSTHRAKEHNDLRPFKCYQCGKGFSTLNFLQKHSFTHWDVEDRLHECDICGSKFADRTNLLVHIRRHTGDYAFSCETCGHKAITTTELRSHMLTHSGNYPFVCDVCGKAYRNKTSLQLHQEKDHIGIVYLCEICNQEFRSKDRLKVHVDSHNEIEDKQCHFCEKTYRRATSLKRHMLSVHKAHKRRKLKLQYEAVCNTVNEDAEEMSE